MVENTHPLTGGARVHNSLLRVALALIVVFGISLATSARAQAAECMTPEACYNAAAWQNAVAKDFFNQGVWFREHSKQYFGLAAEWNAKAAFYFAAGNATAATWSKAVADDYSKKSVANAKAADERFAQAAFTRAAAEGNVRRGIALTAFFNPGPSAQEEAADAASAGTDPDNTIVPAGTVAPRRCKNPENKDWNFMGVRMWIHPSDLCYRKPREVLGVEVGYGNEVEGAQDVQLDDEECEREGTWYNWKGNGPFSGRKVEVTCRWVANPGAVPINIGELKCKARAYFHADGSYWYGKKPKCSIDLAWPF